MTKSINGQWGATSSSSKQGASRSMSPRICDRLRRQQAEPTCNDALQAGSQGSTHANRWKEANASARNPKAVNCLRRMGPRDTEVSSPGPASSTYQELGNVHLLGHSYSFSDFGAPEKFRYHSSLRSYGAHPSKEVDEHMREFPGRQSVPVAAQTKFYQNALAEVEHPIDKPLSKTTSLEWGHPAKHHHCTGKVYPPRDLDREQPTRPPGWKPPEWGMPDKHRYHQPPLWAPKDPGGDSRIHPGKECEIPNVGGFKIGVKRCQAKPIDHGIWV